MDNRPKYKIIEDDLISKIRSGLYPELSIIPKETELADLYGVSRPTVRQAIHALVDMGYLDRKRRKGTIVKHKNPHQEFTHTIERFSPKTNINILSSSTKVITFKEDTADEELAKSLNIKEGDYVYKLVRLRYNEDTPVVLFTNYLPKIYLPDFLLNDFSKNKLYSVLNSYGMGVETIRRKLEVIKSDEVTSDLLGIREGEPLFYFHTTGYTATGVIIEYSISRYRGDLNSFTFEVNRKNMLINDII